jgi:hypothetical protein
MATPELIQSLVAQAAVALNPNTQSLMRMAVALAQDVNRLPGLKGRERLELVQRVLREALAVPAVKDRIPTDAMAILQETITTIIPETLTLVVGASRGEFSLTRPSAGCVAAVAGLLCRSVAAVAGPASQIGRLASQAATVTAVAAVAPPAEPPTQATDGTLTVREPELTAQSKSEPAQ